MKHTALLVLIICFYVIFNCPKISAFDPINGNLLPLDGMKHLLRVFLFNVFAIWITSQIFEGFVISGTWQTLLFAAGILSLLMLIVKPLLKILFIPINIITFGLFSWFINVIILYILTVFVPDVQVEPWIYPGFAWSGFVIPSFEISYFLSLIIASVSITFFTNVFHNISED